MKRFVAAVAFLCVGFAVAPAVQAQSTASPVFGPARQKATPKGKGSAKDIARMQQRMNMNADEVQRDQQQELLNARSGVSTSLSRGSNISRHYDRASGGFTVKKFRGNKRSAAMQKRGLSRPAPGIDPKGKPLKHKSMQRKKKFLFF